MPSLTTRPPSSTADVGVPLVLLPGMNCTSDLWSGCGLEGSVVPELSEPTIDRQVSSLLNGLPPRFSLAGHSLGGIIAMALCRQAPERVERLCLISTNSKGPNDAQRKSWLTWRTRLAAGESPRDLQRDILDALIAEPSLERDPGLAERTLRMGVDTGPERLDAQLRMQDSRIDESSALPRLHMPVLVISGKLDVICPPAFHEDIAAAAPHATLVSVDAGHLAPMERPEEVGQLIRTWLAN